MVENDITQLKPEMIVRGPMLPESVRIAIVQQMGANVKLVGQGLNSGKFYDPLLTPEQLALLEIVTEASYDGDAVRFRLGVEALRLKLAYEYDPYFSLSIARIDPLPHQLEAVYEYFMKLPRIRFLLADDPGAGKTIMAGLLIKELKIRGLIERILIVTPANLTFQWQREMSEKFHESFDVVRGAVLRETYGKNPWQERRQAITSISWISRIADAKESLLRSRWDLVIVDEAHKMSAYSAEKKTMAYQIGEALSEITDHYLLMTATPHKGDPVNFALFLRLLDQDVYGDVSSLQEAMRQREAPFYLRRVKEALVTFPDAQTGKSKLLFTKRNVRTVEFVIDHDEWDFYIALTRYVEEQSIKAAQEDSLRARAIGFTMAMLQRRFASSVYAVRRSLERMKAKREKILKDPEKYRQEQIRKKLPDDFDELPEEEQLRIIEELEELVISIDPRDLQEEILQLSKLITRAERLQQRERETKLTQLKNALTDEGLFKDPAMKLLIFTEHKDTLDYLAGDGREGRPYGKLREWELTVTQIHGGMNVGDRNTPATRIYAEHEFRETCQVMVATEAAGEGINLQFCWFLINYDIPWNPVRLEQRMGRIHRYGQDKDCLIMNFVAINTREGSVLQKLFERVRKIELDLDPQRTGKVFNVLGDIFPSNQLERMIRDMYVHNLTDQVILNRIVEQVDVERFRAITNSTLEGLAKRELNLSAMLGKRAEAKERRLVPEVIREFFLHAAPFCGVSPKATPQNSGVFRIGRIPRTLKAIGDGLETRFGRLAREYRQIVFDKEYLERQPALEWVTPGHPLFETLREYIAAHTQDDVRRGAVFYDVHRSQPTRADLFCAAIKDGRGHTLHERLFVVESEADGASRVQQPTLFLDVVPATGIDKDRYMAAQPPDSRPGRGQGWVADGGEKFTSRTHPGPSQEGNPDSRSGSQIKIPTLVRATGENLTAEDAERRGETQDTHDISAILRDLCGKKDFPDRHQAEQVLMTQALQPFLQEVSRERRKEIEKIARHVEISLNTIIDRVQYGFAELMEKVNSGSQEPGLEGRISQFQDRLDDLNHRLETRRRELEQERHCTISAVQHLGSAWILPHPERHSPEIAEMVRDDAIERIAVQAVIAYEETRGCVVESVESQNRGFDLISRKPVFDDPNSARDERFIEVKGRSQIGTVALTANEYRTAERLQEDYWLYVVFNCAADLEIHIIRNPAQMGWKPIIKIEHYQVGAQEILKADSQ